MRLFIAVSLSFFGLSVAASAVLAQTEKADAKSTAAVGAVPNFAALHGKSIAEYEAVLGKPQHVEPTLIRTETGSIEIGEERYYKVPGLTRVVLNLDKTGLVAITFQFPQASVHTWQEALKMVGYPLEGIQAKTERNGFTLLTATTESNRSISMPWIPVGAGYTAEATDDLHINHTGSHQLTLSSMLDINANNLLKAILWEQYVEPGAEAKFEENREYVSITTSKSGKDPWSVQIWPALPFLQNGRMYTLSFEAKADQEIQFTFNVGMRDTPYLPSGFQRDNEPIAATWHPYRFTFIAQNGDQGVVKVPSFWWGKSSGTLYLRHLSFVLVGPTQ